MKIKVDVDATPQELRTFFGLPDVQPLHEEMIKHVRENMLSGVEGYDPLSLMSKFLPDGMKSVESMQKIFWEAFRKNMDMTTSTFGGGKSND